MSAAGESEDAYASGGEAQARSARPRVWAAADTRNERKARSRKEAAKRAAPRDWLDTDAPAIPCLMVQGGGP